MFYQVLNPKAKPSQVLDRIKHDMRVYCFKNIPCGLQQMEFNVRTVSLLIAFKNKIKTLLLKEAFN